MRSSSVGRGEGLGVPGARQFVGGHDAATTR